MVIEELYRRYFPAIEAKCRRTLGDGEEARDVAQETFIRLWKAGPRTAAPAALLAWIYQTSTHLAVDRLRRRRAGAGAAGSRTETSSPESAVINRQLLEHLATLAPARELELAVLARVDGLTQAEIALVSGDSERTIRRLLAQFDERLRSLDLGAAS